MYLNDNHYDMPSFVVDVVADYFKQTVQRHIVERTNKAEIRPEEQSDKAESCWENLWNEIQLRGQKRQK